MKTKNFISGNITDKHKKAHSAYWEAAFIGVLLLSVISCFLISNHLAT